ncbi:MAG: hypothetical protein ACSHX5_12685 [Phycisphaerales bacterium]
MRLLTRKIYRAFPELDQFDDSTCERYISRISKISTGTIGCLVILLVVVLSFIAWAYIEYNTRQLLYFILKKQHVKMGVYLDTFVLLFAYSGFIWFPWLSVLVARDRWLYRGIRKQLNGALCKECEYSLLGLTVMQDLKVPYVKCPECGCENKLTAGILTKEDIDPMLVNS